MLNRELLCRYRVEIAGGFEDEYKKIILPKPNSSKIDAKIFELIDFISRSYNPTVFCGHKCIEKLKNSAGLYVIKIKIDCNIRIIFSLKKDGTIFLHLFEEKMGKRITEYSSAISTAKKRLQ